jgi:hypothetical protein
MDIEQESDFILSVSRGQNQQWHVSVQEVQQPLATFNTPQAACAWAIARAKPRRGRVLVEELETDDAGYADAALKTTGSFKFSIPVAWTDNSQSRLPSARR